MTSVILDQVWLKKLQCVFFSPLFKIIIKKKKKTSVVSEEDNSITSLQHLYGWIR